jgi:hypothetical protein
MQYTHVTEDINQICFVGFNPEDNAIIPATQVDPNIVKIMPTTPLTIAGHSSSLHRYCLLRLINKGE